MLRAALLSLSIAIWAAASAPATAQTPAPGEAPAGGEEEGAPATDEGEEASPRQEPPQQEEEPPEPPDAAEQEIEPPFEFQDPDGKLAQFAALIAAKRMEDFYIELIRVANLTHPVKNIDPAALRRIGHSLLGLFLENEEVYWVDKVKDETFGESLRRAVYLAYTSRDRWIYFNFVLKRGRAGWQLTKFDYFVDRFDLFPEPRRR